MMRFKRISPVSGKLNIRDIDVTSQQIWDWQNGMMIQNAMPNISTDDREFILTGITPEEFPKESEE